MKNIVLIADCVDDNRKISLANSDLECIYPEYFNDVYSTLLEISPKVTHYITPKQFLENISLHKEDVVLSIWSGQLSRNRKALVPSICESYDIKYVGADPYVHLLSQDKQLSKYICSQYNIHGARDILIRNINELTQELPIKYPVIVKPNQEGGSNGISEKSIAFEYSTVYQLSDYILKHFNQPVLIEEYIEGREICITIAGQNGKIDVLEADEIIIENISENAYPIFGYEAKKIKSTAWHRTPATHLLEPEIKKNVVNLFNSLGKVDILRVDGKIANNTFSLLELTPDVHLGTTASIAYDFELAGYSYKEMLSKLVSYASC